MYFITAIIPAFNEEKTIGKVISTVKKVDLVDNIIVVSDGSKDDTVYIANKFNVEVIELKENLGKGCAIKRGVEESKGNILVFLDADLVGLTPEHITSLLTPLISDEYHMSIGVFNHGRIYTDFAQKITPFLSGQRAIKREIFDEVPNIDIMNYGVEMALTKFIKQNRFKVIEVPLKDLTHLMKEEKMGIIKGFKERLKMYLEILKFIITDVK